ncbi:hypothetical protein AEQ67_09830 [Pseudomonas sp. RIT-PI-q]|nr:hypothetical protein AEQ67_09830 [Pseudomonas sp. RIT-PI-q]
MRWILAVTGTLLSLTAIAADKDPIATQVMKDQFFSSAECGKYLDGFAAQEQDTLSELADVYEKSQALGFVAGRDTLLGDFQTRFIASNLRFNSSLVEFKEKLKDKPNLLSNYEYNGFSRQTIDDTSKKWKAILNSKKSKPIQANIKKFTWCRIAAVGAGMGVNAQFPSDYVQRASAITNTADIGYFRVKAESGEYGKSVGTGNKYSEPKTWAGSRFFIVHASFKNLDTESRQPFEGSLFINYNGKDYEFDSTEPIMLEGYNMWFRKINPLITMKTKLVYRIPDEIYGDVYWRPGRNPTDTKLWVGNVEAAK